MSGFSWHSHRGIETITYILKGDLEHCDSLGNKGLISSGDVQWMTAGSGVIHQEMPKGDSQGFMEGFQLWVNLPSHQKMINPAYRDVTSNQIPVVTLPNGIIIKIIAGEISGTKGPVQDIISDPNYMDVTIPGNSEFTYPTKQDHTVFAYIIEGQGYFCKEKNPFTYEAEGANYFNLKRDPFLDNGTIVLFEPGDEVRVFTENHPIRFLLLSGKPLNEPIAWHGPIVMNTQEEIRIAFEEYRNSEFIK